MTARGRAGLWPPMLLALGAGGSLLPAPSMRAAQWLPVREGMREVLGLATNGSTYVAVGSFGEIHTSPDGFSWTRSLSPSAVTLRGVTFGAGQFVAVGLCCAFSASADDAGVVLTSPDGTNWTQRFPGAAARGRDLFAVAFGGGVFVAVGSAGTVIRSTDGVTWSAASSGTPNDLLGVGFGGGLFVAVGANRTVITSPDGAAWTVQPGVPQSIGSTLNGVVHTGSSFVAAGSAGGLVTSPNGSSWTARSVPTTASLTAVGAAGGLAIAVGYGTILSSPNGTTWTARSFVEPGAGVSRALRAVVSGPAGFLAAGSQGALYASVDGVTPWTSRSVLSSRGLFAVAHDGTRYCAVGTSGAVARSLDGVQWTHGSGLSVIPTWPWAALARGAGVFVAAGAGAEIMSSPDCATWTERNAGRAADPATAITGDIQDVAFGNATFVAVGEEFPDAAPGIALIATSPDGVSWTQRSSGLPTNVERSLTAVGFGNGSFVALGTEWSTGASILLTSPNGVTWTSQSTPFTAFESFADVTFGNGVFVAVGDRIWTSPNGTTWTLRQGYSDAHFHGVSFGGGRFVAVGRLGAVVSSADGLTWTPDTPGSADSHQAVAFGSNRFASVGDSATTLLACVTPPPDPVVDGSFEGGTPNASWVEASTTFGTPLCDLASCGSAGARTGAWWVWFGGVSSALEQGSVEQTVTIPSGIATLVFYLAIDASSGNGTDFVRALLDGTPVFTALEGDPTYSSGYVRVQVDVTGFADGGSHLLRFESTSAGTGPNLFSSFFVDDVSIDTCTPTPRSFSIGDVAVVEGNAGSRNAVFTTFLSARDSQPHAVSYATANGSAGGSDYTSASGPLSFPAQALSRTITVQVTGDVAPEPDETFAVNLAGPSGAVLEDASGQGTIVDDDSPIDLSITKTDGQATVAPGAPLSYTIVVTNNSAHGVSGATVTDVFAAAFTGVTWLCSASAGSSCVAASGSGNVSAALNLLPGGTATLLAAGTVSPSATGTLSNTATVAPPAGITDPSPGNNSATDVDLVVVPADLSISKSDGLSVATPGQAITYTIVVSNAGPGSVTGAAVSDVIPASLTGATWTCSGSGGGTCTASGSGNINDAANLPIGGSATYLLSATVSANPGSLSNTATVATPSGQSDPNAANNSATDTDALACFGAGVVVPDGRVTSATIGGGATVWLGALLTAGSSYSLELKNTTGGSTPPGTLTVFSGGCSGMSTLITTNTTAIEPRIDQGGVRVSFTPAAAGLLHFRLQNASGAAIPYSFSLSQTTLYSASWSTNGSFNTFYSFQNTTNSTVTGTLTFLNTIGAPVGSPATVTVPAGQTMSQNSVGLALPRNQTGTARFTHNGPPGSIVAEAAIANFALNPAYVQPVRFVAVREAR